MPPIVMVLVFGAFGLLALWALRRDLRTGASADSMYRFRADTNPFGFALLIVGKIGVVLLCAAVVLDALGYSAPMSLIRGVIGR